MRAYTNYVRAGLVLLLMSVNTPSGQPTAQKPGEFKPAAPASVVSWQVKRLAPPSALYVGVNDRLRLVAATSQTSEVVTIGYRLLRAADGQIVTGSFTVAPANTRAVATATQQLAEGFLLSVTASAAVATVRGQTFARLLLAPTPLGSSLAAQALMADYVTNQMAPAYPSGRVIAPTEGPGRVYEVTISNPAAGADWAISLPTNVRWRIVCLTSKLTTSATVATRFPQLNIVQSAVAWIGNTTGSFTASQGVGIQGAAVPWQVLANSGLDGWAMPPELYLEPPASISTSTINLQAGDTWTNIRMLVEEWLQNV